MAARVPVPCVTTAHRIRHEAGGLFGQDPFAQYQGRHVLVAYGPTRYGGQRNRRYRS